LARYFPLFIVGYRARAPMRRAIGSAHPVNRMHNIASIPKKPSRRRLTRIDPSALFDRQFAPLNATERQP
jgi:hypothetical protein